ncbi:MAG TPA: signal peptidase I [Candidatus Angelobacter sp.]|jgi:signal peptidase I|nr:signal peptidase I [Candidatus Angelobacter sp.]
MAENELKNPAEAVPAPPTADRPRRILYSWIRDLFFSVIVSLFIILFVYQPVRVEGGSMEPGLEDQERIFINKLVYRLEAIGRGDIIVFRYPRDPRKNFIKRVIAIPGDRIRITHGHVYVNGQFIREPYVPELYQDSSSCAEITIPADSYFVMGDHRTMSKDSREFGPVARDLIYGKAVFGYWPVERVGVLH